MSNGDAISYLFLLIAEPDRKRNNASRHDARKSHRKKDKIEEWVATKTIIIHIADANTDKPDKRSFRALGIGEEGSTIQFLHNQPSNRY